MKSIEYSDVGPEVNDNSNDKVETDLNQIKTDIKSSDQSTDLASKVSENNQIEAVGFNFEESGKRKNSVSCCE